MSPDGSMMVKYAAEQISNAPYTSNFLKDLWNGLKGEFKLASLFKAHENTSDYEVGSWDVRSWGYYIVTSVTKNADTVTECQKDICVFPNQMLSLQAHEGRDEIWTVKKGTLTVIVNGKMRDLKEGESVTLKAGDIHCMINRTNNPVQVHEIQSGVCQEKDNMRLMDFGGRKTVDYNHADLTQSKELYQGVMNTMPQSLAKHISNAQNTLRMWKSRAMFLSQQPKAA